MSANKHSSATGHVRESATDLQRIVDAALANVPAGSTTFDIAPAPDGVVIVVARAERGRRISFASGLPRAETEDLIRKLCRGGGFPEPWGGR